MLSDDLALEKPDSRTVTLVNVADTFVHDVDAVFKTLDDDGLTVPMRNFLSHLYDFKQLLHYSYDDEEEEEADYSAASALAEIAGDPARVEAVETALASLLVEWQPIAAGHGFKHYPTSIEEALQQERAAMSASMEDFREAESVRVMLFTLKAMGALPPDEGAIVEAAQKEWDFLEKQRREDIFSHETWEKAYAFATTLAERYGLENVRRHVERTAVLRELPELLAILDPSKEGTMSRRLQSEVGACFARFLEEQESALSTRLQPIFEKRRAEA